MEGRESEREAEAVAALFALPPLKELLRLGTPRLLRALAEETPLERPAATSSVSPRSAAPLGAPTRNPHESMLVDVTMVWFH